MAQSFLTGSIAGVTLEGAGGDPLRAMLIGGGNVLSARAVNSHTSAGGTVYTQSFLVSAGIAFSIRFDFIPPDLLADLVAAIKTAIDSQNSFAVNVQDDIQTVAVNAVVAGSEWLKIEPQRTNDITVKSVEMSFLTA